MTTSDIKKRVGLIAEGIPFILNNITIQTTDSGKLMVIGWTDTVHFENVTRAKTMQELYALKASYSELACSYEELNDMVKDNKLLIEYHISYDSGKAGIGLCSEIEGKLHWYIA